MSETASARSAGAYLSAASVPRAGVGLEPDVTGFYDEATGSVQYLVADPITRRCAIIDPVLDFDPTSGATRKTSADRLLRHIEAQGLILEWILDTHPHADHFSAAGYLKDVTGAPTAIGEWVTEVQKIWKKTLQSDLPDEWVPMGSFVCRWRTIRSWRVAGAGAAIPRSHVVLRHLPNRRRGLCARHCVHAGFGYGARRFSRRRCATALAEHSTDFAAAGRHAPVYRP